MKVSIVLGTFNRLEQVRRCIDSIERETTVAHRVYVTDGGSTDGTVEYLRSVASDKIIPIFVGRLLGQAKAYNDVFAQIDTPLVCWLSDDNEIVNAGLDRAARILERDARIGMVGLKTRDLEGPFVDAPYIGGISEIGVLNVNQGMLPTPVLRQVGGFSEVFRNYGIDPDLTAKVLFSGFRVVYTRAVAVHHHRNWSMDHASPEYVALTEKHERSRRLYSAKYLRWADQSRMLRIKKHAFDLMSRMVGHPGFLDSRRRYLGGIPRDWFNSLHGRFIRAFDPILFASSDYHLVQRCPARLMPKSLPPEPDELALGSPVGDG